ncbi:clavesin-1 isoform X2 [Lycorma delicatula]|uniref:clavesin-1 isoform X2 n=1 Tax=Lycorma delicatula TaxID=130591 RepID=UPI003F50D81F
MESLNKNGMGDNCRFRLQTGQPGPEAQEIARVQLRETKEHVEEAIEKLRKLLRADNTIYFRDDVDTLMIFLRPTKFYPESAFDLMKRVSDFKEKHENVLKGLTAESERSSLTDNKVVNVLVDRDQHGRRILIANIGGLWDTQKVSSNQLFRVFYLIHLVAMLEPETQIRGVVVILDFNGFSYSQFRQMSIEFSNRLLKFIQKAMPLRLKEVHIVKEPFLFNAVWTLFKPFVEEKLQNRLFIHGKKMNSLHQHIHPDYLPAEYDGNKPTMDYSSADWYPVLCSIEDHVAAWQSYGKVKNDKKP